MVKTRRQIKQREEELEKLRSLPPSALPPKVCCTPPVKRTLSIMSTKSEATSAKKKKKLTFAPEPPKEFHFDFKSPPIRRIMHTNYEALHDSVVRLEFEARGLENSVPEEIGEKERETYKSWVIRDLKQDLKIFHGVDCDHIIDDLSGLRERIELAETLRRRVEIRRTPQFKMVPHEMNLKDIQKELYERRIAFQGLTHYQASKALEHSLLKEDAEGLVGEGYQFGRRFLSAADVVSYYQPSDKQMRDMLQSRSLPVKMIPRKKTEKLELLSKFVELEQEEVMRQLLKQEVVQELTRRKIQCDSESYSDMFEALFSSNKWREPYEGIELTEFTPDEQAHACIIS